MVIACKEFLGHKITATSHLPAGQIAMSRHSVGHTYMLQNFGENAIIVAQTEFGGNC